MHEESKRTSRGAAYFRRNCAPFGSAVCNNNVKQPTMQSLQQLDNAILARAHTPHQHIHFGRARVRNNRGFVCMPCGSCVRYLQLLKLAPRRGRS